MMPVFSLNNAEEAQQPIVLSTSELNSKLPLQLNTLGTHRQHPPTHTHTHTHIYIYIYIVFNKTLRLDVAHNQFLSGIKLI